MRTRFIVALLLVLAGMAGAQAASPHRDGDTPAPPAAATARKDAPDDADDGDDHPMIWPADVGSPEQVIYAQPERMRQALAHLTPRTPGKPNLYVISFAGDGEEDVFRNEVDYAEQLFSTRFAARGHILTLVNNPSTLSTRPIASLSNLELAIDGIGKKMKPEQDILFVFLTTHGSPKHELYVSLDPLPLDQVVPDDLADLFSDSPIRHRVFVISACYSGGYVDALKGADTMVITAARADRASFGCGTQSDITDFGRAFFVDALNRTGTFADAFTDASKSVDEWETRDHQPHSFPQISSGPEIDAALKRWYASFVLGPAVPFAPLRRRALEPASVVLKEKQ